MLRQALIVYDGQCATTREAMAMLTSELHRRSITTLQTYPRKLGAELPCSELLILCVTLRNGIISPPIAPLVNTLSPDGCAVPRIGLVVVVLDEREVAEDQVDPGELARHAGLALTQPPLILRAPGRGQVQVAATTQQMIRDFVWALLETPLRVDLSRVIGQGEQPHSAGPGAPILSIPYRLQYSYA